MKRALFLLLALGFLVGSQFKQSKKSVMKKKPIAFISTEPSEAPFQENPDEQPEQGESQDSKEIEDSDPKKCTVYPILFSKLSVIGKIEWTMMIATQAIEPFIQELLQPPEVFLKS